MNPGPLEMALREVERTIESARIYLESGKSHAAYERIDSALDKLDNLRAILPKEPQCT